MVIDNKILDDLSAQAKASSRLRMAMDLRNSPEDPYHPLEEDEIFE